MEARGGNNIVEARNVKFNVEEGREDSTISRESPAVRGEGMSIPEVNSSYRGGEASDYYIQQKSNQRASYTLLKRE